MFWSSPTWYNMLVIICVCKHLKYYFLSLPFAFTSIFQESTAVFWLTSVYLRLVWMVEPVNKCWTLSVAVVMKDTLVSVEIRLTPIIYLWPMLFMECRILLQSSPYWVNNYFILAWQHRRILHRQRRH